MTRKKLRKKRGNRPRIGSGTWLTTREGRWKHYVLPIPDAEPDIRGYAVCGRVSKSIRHGWYTDGQKRAMCPECLAWEQRLSPNSVLADQVGGSKAANH